MKYYINFIATLFLICPFLLSAQTIQEGVVKEYNEKAKKTPLPGVELRVSSAANTASDKKGLFALNFLTLNPGDKINVRRIEKLGFEIFNKEAIEQWNINPKTPFVIVMCRSEKFKKIRDNYQRLASANYDSQFNKEQERLTKLKQDGKIKEGEYKKRLNELAESYERQLDNLDNYVDRFSRIDLSELSADEQEIIELVQQGKFEEAIQKYEEQNYLGKYKQEVADIKDITSAIGQLDNIKEAKVSTRDRLLDAIDRQIKTLKIAGGKDNFDKISQILHDVALTDTVNSQNMYKYGAYLEEQNCHYDAISTLKIAMNNCNDMSLYFKIAKTLSEAYNSISDFKASESLIKNILKQRPPNNLEDHARLLYALATANYKQTNFDEAERIYIEALTLVGDDVSDLRGNIYYALSTLNRTCKNFDTAQKYAVLALNNFVELDNASQIPYMEDSNREYRIMQCKSNIAKIYFYSNNNDQAAVHFSQLSTEYKNLYENNPRKFAEDYAWILVLYSKSLTRQGKFKDALIELDIALSLYEGLYEKYPSGYGKSYSQSLQDYGENLIRLNRNADYYFDKANDIVNSLYELDMKAFAPLYLLNLYKNAFRYYSNENYAKSIEINKRAEQVAKYLFEHDEKTYAEMYTSILLYLGGCYECLTQYDKALEYYLNATQLRKRLYEEKLGITSVALADCYRKLGNIYSYIDKYEDAIMCYTDAYNYYNSIIETKPQYKAYAIAMQRDIAEIYSSCLNNEESALNAIDLALSFDTQNISILEQKGLIYCKYKNFDKSSEILETILKIDPAYDKTESKLVLTLSQNE